MLALFLPSANTSISPAEMTNCIKAYIDELHAEAVQADLLKKTGGEERRSMNGFFEVGAGQGRGSARKVKVVMSDYLVRWVVSKCTEEEVKGRLDEAAIALVQAGAISTRAHPRLVPYAIEVDHESLPWRADLRRLETCSCLRLFCETCMTSRKKTS